MVSIKIFEQQVQRFLSDPTPEVLCIKGKWGVGKTFGWRKFLRDARKRRDLALDRYAYVSLFGLNSLDELRYAIFERTVSGKSIGEDPTPETLREVLKSGANWRKLRPIVESIAGFFNAKDAASTLAKSATLFVRDQLICLDDLERAGKDLTPTEVLGIASLLKEERACKVVLLLNEEAFEEERGKEFAKHLEKVADLVLRFEPTSAEATKIALEPDQRGHEYLKARIEQLGITNIRVIKRIESQAEKLYKILEERPTPVIEEALATLVLAVRSVLETQTSPPLKYFKDYTSFVMKDHFADNEEDKDARFAEVQDELAGYPFNGTDELDLAIIEGVEKGYFDREQLQGLAVAKEGTIRAQTRENALSKVWQNQYFGTLQIDDQSFLDAMFDATIGELKYLSLNNLNGSIKTLRENERADQADEVIAAYIRTHSHQTPEFFDPESGPFAVDNIDEALKQALELAKTEYKDPRAPLEVLREIGQNDTWSERDAQLIAGLDESDLREHLSQLAPEEVPRSVKTLQRLGASHGAWNAKIRATTNSVLREIAKSSPLSAQRIKGLGIKLEED